MSDVSPHSDHARILMEVHEGRVVSVLLENGFLATCAGHGVAVDVLTPAADLPGFAERYRQPGVTFHRARLLRRMSRMEALELRLGRWLTVRGQGRLRRALWEVVGQPTAVRGAREERRWLADLCPTAVFTPHVAEGFGRGLVAAARSAGIPTVGNVMSWDNPYRPLLARPDVLACWSDRTRGELVRLSGCTADRIRVVGAPQFDPYHAPDFSWSRDELCAAVGLDPQRPFVVFATLGQFRPFMDETGTFAAFLEAVDGGRIRPRPQVVLRLHPLSRLAYYQPYLGRDDVVVSRFTSYLPGMMWAPRRDEVVLAGNLLAHAAVCVSPGSTMTLETALFDTPTVMPAFNPYTGDEYAEFFDAVWLQQHFRWIVEEDLVPVARTTDELAGAVNRGLAERGWYRSERARLKHELVGPTDGRATRRLAELVVEQSRRDRRRAA